MEQLTSDQRTHMFEVWENLPPIKYLSKEEYSIMDNPIRDAIVKAIRRGIKDEEFGKPRRVLSMSELLIEVNRMLKEMDESSKELKKPNLYYHVDLLLEHDLLQETMTIKIGKHHQSFYTRTTKGFILGKHTPDHEINRFQNIHSKLILALNKKTDNKSLNEVFQTIRNKRSEIIRQRDDWIQNNLSTITYQDIDIIDMVDSLEWYYHVHPDVIGLYQKLGDLLKLPGFKVSPKDSDNDE